MFVDMVRQKSSGSGSTKVAAAAPAVDLVAAKMITRPADLPVFGKEFMTIE
jgi:hypothetical protein